MQIHELNNFTGTLGSGAYLAIDDGTDTGKISSQGLLAATEARIDNIIAGPAPSAEEIVDARLGADGVTYPTLGGAIRTQVTDLKSALIDTRHGEVVFGASDMIQGSYNSSSPYNVVSTTTKIRNKRPILLSAGDVLTIKPNAVCAYFDAGFYTANGAWIAETNWINQERSYTFTDDRIVVIVFKNSDNSTIVASDYDATTTFVTKQQLELNTHDTKIAKIYGSVLTEKDYTHELSSRCYQTNGGVGSTVDMTGYTEAQYRSFVLPCVRGDVFKISGTGVNFYRLWCFTDENYVIKAVATANASATNTELLAEQDGFFIYQISTAYAGYYIKHMNAIVTESEIEYLTMFTGFGMFQSIAGIGDSYTEGDMVNSGGSWVTKAGINYIDIIGKRNGVTAKNYGSGGKTTKTYQSSQAFANALSDSASDFYIFALGQNDINVGTTLGTIADINDSDYTQNPDTFYGNYGKVIAQIIAHAPNAKFAIVGSWIKGTSSSSGIAYQSYNPAIKEIASHYGIPYIEPFDDPFFSSKLYSNYKNNGHPTAMGYAGMAIAMERLFSKCVVDNPNYFKLALIG